MLLFTIISQIQSQPSDTGTDIFPTIVGYGVASPLIAFLVWYINQQGKERKELSEKLDKEQTEIRHLSERLLDQQKELLPLAKDMTELLAQVSERFERERRQERR